MSFGGFFSSVTGSGDNSNGKSPKNEEVEVGAAKNEKVGGDEDDFDPVLFHRLLMSSRAEDTGAVNGLLFLNAIDQVPKLVNGLGKVLKAGNGALVDKIGIVRGRLKETAEDLKVTDAEVALQDIIERDIQNKWTHSGKKARRATRNIIRLVWFLDFVVALFQKIVNAKIETVKEVISQCWSETLGPRNRKLVNMGTKQAIRISSFPSREEMFKMLKIHEMSEEDRNNQMLSWSDDINSVAEHLWSYFKEKKIEVVP